jgi:integrase
LPAAAKVKASPPSRMQHMLFAKAIREMACPARIERATYGLEGFRCNSITYCFLRTTRHFKISVAEFVAIPQKLRVGMVAKTAKSKHEQYGAGYILTREGKRGTAYLARIRRVDVNGNKADVSKTFKTKDEARAYIDESSVELRKGVNLDYAQIKKLPISYIYQEYIDENPKNARNYRLKRMLNTFSQINLEEFTSIEFEKLLKVFLETPVPKQKREDGKETNKHKLHNAYMVKNENGELVRRTYSESTVRKYYYDAKIVLEWHSRFRKYPFNPEPFKKSLIPQAWGNQKARLLKDGELENILKGWDTLRENVEKGKQLTTFLIKTGFRIGETLLIQKKHVHLDLNNPAESYIFIPKKNQKGGNVRKKTKINDRYCPIREEIFYLLKDKILPSVEKDDDILFPEWKNGPAFYKRFKNACVNVGIEDITVHSLRSFAIAYYFAETLLTDIEIMNISGHIETSTLRGYTKLRPQKTGIKLWKGLA